MSFKDKIAWGKTITIREAYNRLYAWQVDFRQLPDGDTMRVEGLSMEQALPVVVRAVAGGDGDAAAVALPRGIVEGDWIAMRNHLNRHGWRLAPGFFLVDGCYRLFRLESPGAKIVEYFDSFEDVETAVVLWVK